MASLPSYQSHLKAVGAGILLSVLGIGGYLWLTPSASAELPTVTVYKNPSCGCCSDWVSHMRDQGFEVEVSSQLNMERIRNQAGLPPSLAACHTATVGDYVVEGHVPASEVKQLLRETPDVRGLSVPGMPVGSPGMEQGSRVEQYDVLTFTEEGDTSVFARHGQQ